MIRAAVLLSLVTGLECRVKYSFSAFLDGNDLKTVSQTNFSCTKGCMVYSATENANLAIVNEMSGLEVTNLNSLANYNNGNDRSYLYGFALQAAVYILKDKAGLSGATFGLYVVSNEASNYGQALRVADAFATATFNTNNGLMTIMTRGTGIRMVSPTNVNGDAMTPRVYATGYDALGSDNCWAIYTANSLSHAQQSQIDVIGPIATIKFDGLPGLATASVKVSGDVLSEAADTRNSLTISSAGFHGCSNVQGLYQYNMNALDRRFRSDLTGGVNIRIRGKLSIAIDADALYISGLQDQTMKFMGIEEYSPGQNYLDSKVDLHLTEQRTNPNSNFALQMDATKSAANASILIALIASVFFVMSQ